MSGNKNVATPDQSEHIGDDTTGDNIQAKRVANYYWDGANWQRVGVTQAVAGNKTNNNAAPGATNLGVLPAIANAVAPTYTEGNQVLESSDLSGNIRSTLGTLSAGEDQTNNVLRVEGQFSYKRVTADGQIKASAGFVHAITISPTTATPTAGLLTLYDSTTEANTIIFTEWVFATDTAHTIILDVVCGTGIYVGYDATLTNVSATVSYR